MSSKISYIFVLITKKKDDMISNRRNCLSFSNEYFIIVHNKSILKTVDIKTLFDKMWHIVEYLFANIFSFLVVFNWNKSNTIIIFIHHESTV